MLFSDLEWRFFNTLTYHSYNIFLALNKGSKDFHMFIIITVRLVKVHLVSNKHEEVRQGKLKMLSWY